MTTLREWKNNFWRFWPIFAFLAVLGFWPWVASLAFHNLLGFPLGFQWEIRNWHFFGISKFRPCGGVHTINTKQGKPFLAPFYHYRLPKSDPPILVWLHFFHCTSIEFLTHYKLTSKFESINNSIAGLSPEIEQKTKLAEVQVLEKNVKVFVWPEKNV